VLAATRAFVGQIDRLPLPVKSAPGFLVNRALTPYMLEAMVMLDEKVPKEIVDEAAEAFGMPMGPIELADTVGLDICLAVGDSLRAKLGDALPPAPDWLRQKVEAGELGRKTGKGFYVWKDGKAQKSKPVGDAMLSSTAAAKPAPQTEIVDRLILPMVNVCVACFREGIVENADVVDGAMIFGTGFAPFRGGPLNYARTRGVADVVAVLRSFSQTYGERFTPDPGWDSFK
jgi:3-hydroxyacyl-CoA dehydrogenase/enoyl-CoA hydratase/3-hydroxybutyryl-CoA epimerase